MDEKQLVAILKMKDEMSGVIKVINDNLKELDSQQEKVGKSNKIMMKDIKNASKELVKAGAVMSAIPALAIKDAVSFESAFAGVVKTVDATTEEISEFRTELLEMSTRIPKTVEDLAKIAEIGGQLNVGIKDMKKFTETVAMLTDSTDISLEEGTLQIAQFMNVMKENMNNIDKVGSAITYLGNNSATTESKILSMASRIARSSKMIGMSSSDVLGISTAIASTGIEAEMGGSAFSKFAIDIQNAVTSSSSDLKTYAKLANTTTKEFQNLFKQDPAKAMSKVISGIGTSSDPYAVIDDLGIKEVRLRETVLALAGSHEELAKYLDSSANAFSENSALAEEAAKRYGTSESALAMMKNQIRYASIEIGTAMLPVVRDLAEAIGGLASKFNALSPEQKEMISKFILGGLVIGGLITVLGALGLAFTGIASVIAFICSPIGLVVLAISSLIMFVVNLKMAWDTNWNGIKDKTLEVIEKIKGWWQGLKDFLAHPIKGTINFVKKGVENAKNAINDFRNSKDKGGRNAFGSGRIARNDELRRLHQGEKILTRREADQYEKGLGQSTGVVVHVNGLTVREEADIDRIANAFVRKLNQGRIVVGGVTG